MQALIYFKRLADVLALNNRRWKSNFSIFLLLLGGRYSARHATPTAMAFFLVNFYPSGPFTCIFSKTSPEFFLCWLWLTPDLVWARRIKQVTLLIVTIEADYSVDLLVSA